MWFDLFLDIATITIQADTLFVQFTHWVKKRKSFKIQVTDIIAVAAVQIEPFILTLVLKTKENSQFVLSEDMQGWNKAVDLLQSHLKGFDPDAIEMAKGKINQSFLCWSA